MLNSNDKITKQYMNRKKVTTGENSSGENFACKLESRWSELHFGFTQRIFVSLPRIPVHAISKRRVGTKVINTIQI